MGHEGKWLGFFDSYVQVTYKTRTHTHTHTGRRHNAMYKDTHKHTWYPSSYWLLKQRRWLNKGWRCVCVCVGCRWGSQVTKLRTGPQNDVERDVEKKDKNCVADRGISTVDVAVGRVGNTLEKNDLASGGGCVVFFLIKKRQRRTRKRVGKEPHERRKKNFNQRSHRRSTPSSI